MASITESLEKLSPVQKKLQLMLCGKILGQDSMNLIPCSSISFIFCISFLALQKFSTEGKKINSTGFFY